MNAEPPMQVIASAAPPRSFYQRHQHLLHGRLAQFLIACLLAVAFTTLLWQLRAPIYRFWNASITQLLAELALDGARMVPGNMLIHGVAFETQAISLPLLPPDLLLLFIHLGTATAGYIVAGLAHAPFRAPLRFFCVLHALGVLASLALAGGNAYSVEEHTRMLGLFTQGTLLILPIVMAFTHYIVERSNERRIVATFLIAAYLIAVQPVKLVAHVLLLQAAGGLAMPTLFLLFGPVLDIFAVTALYAWVVTWRHGQSS